MRDDVYVMGSDPINSPSQFTNYDLYFTKKKKLIELKVLENSLLRVI